MAPPELLPLDGQHSRIRIPLGTKSFKLTCPVRVGREHGGSEEEEEELMIKWSRNGEPLMPEGGADAQLRILNGDRDLRIRAPQPRDSGRYRCTAINEWGHRVVDFELEVFDPEGTGGGAPPTEEPGGSSLSEKVSAPKWRDPATPSSTHLRLSPGSALRLQCPPSIGNPLPQVIWMREGLPVSLELTNPSLATFSLDRVRPQDSATYSCRVQNQLGSVQSDFRVQVTSSFDSSSPASDSDQPSLFGASSSASGTFHASGGPSAALPLPPTPRIDHPRTSENGNSNGSVASVRVGHTAQLLCRVEWRRDKSVIRWLRMVGNADALRARQPNATILRMGEMVLLVLDQGSDAVRVEQEPQGERVFVNELRIPNVQQEDSGRYFCVVTNPAGQFVYRSALLRVLPAPPPASGPFRLLFRHFPSSLLIPLFIILPSILIILSLLLFFFRRSRRSSSSRRPFRKCCPLLPLPSSSHPNKNCSSHTFASSSSSSSDSSSGPPPLHPPFSSALIPPPPPRMPAPAPPPMVWPIRATTLERSGRGTVQSPPPPHPLHRTTERAEDEMSRMSSHIYASGSPLPPHHHHPHHPLPFHSTDHHPHHFFLSQLHHQPLPSPSQQIYHQQDSSRSAPANQKAQLPPVPRKGVAGGTMRTAVEEQRMPLIEAQRQSAELWLAN